ncbi:MAG: Rieske (2Fe-2S) domain protein [Myxococcales bacterium]|nr:Rieske (2Fe-2S) domain protein [Myxococcales bacterium]
MSSQRPMNRRTASKLLVLLPVAACAHRRTAVSAPAGPAFDAGPVEDYPPSSAVRFRIRGVIVVRDQIGVMAVSAICTHEGCVVSLQSDSLVCECHHSVFTMEGDVIQGPATRPLPHFKVTLLGTRIYVDPGQVVPATDRLIV